MQLPSKAFRTSLQGVTVQGWCATMVLICPTGEFCTLAPNAQPGSLNVLDKVSLPLRHGVTAARLESLRLM